MLMSCEKSLNYFRSKPFDDLICRRRKKNGWWRLCFTSREGPWQTKNIWWQRKLYNMLVSNNLPIQDEINFRFCRAIDACFERFKNEIRFLSAQNGKSVDGKKSTVVSLAISSGCWNSNCQTASKSDYLLRGSIDLSMTSISNSKISLWKFGQSVSNFVAKICVWANASWRWATPSKV